MRSVFPNIRHMRVFVAAADTGSVSAAADRCHLSQPAATQAITQLEKNLGVTLIIRRRQQFSLTIYGEIFQQRAEAALLFLENGALAAQRIGGVTNRNKFSFDRFVTFAQIRNLIAIANTGSFTVAAQTLNLSQPTVQRAARSLEAISGLSFFMARQSGVTLTLAAESFLQGAKLALSEVRQELEEISFELSENKGLFVLGTMPLARTSIVPRAVNELVKSTNNFQIKLIDGRYSELLKSLREGDIDCLIGALRFPLPADDIIQKPIFEDALVVVAHPNHPLSNKVNPTLDDALEFPWVAPPKETPAGQFLFETLKINELDQTPVRIVSSSLITLRGILAEGNYISVISRHQIRVEEKLGAIKVLDIPLKSQYRTIGLTFRKGWRPTKAQEKFIELLYKHGEKESL